MRNEHKVALGEFNLAKYRKKVRHFFEQQRKLFGQVQQDPSIELAELLLNDLDSSEVTYKVQASELVTYVASHYKDSKQDPNFIGCNFVTYEGCGQSLKDFFAGVSGHLFGSNLRNLEGYVRRFIERKKSQKLATQKIILPVAYQVDMESEKFIKLLDYVIFVIVTQGCDPSFDQVVDFDIRGFQSSDMNLKKVFTGVSRCFRWNRRVTSYYAAFDGLIHIMKARLSGPLARLSNIDLAEHTKINDLLSHELAGPFILWSVFKEVQESQQPPQLNGIKAFINTYLNQKTIITLINILQDIYKLFSADNAEFPKVHEIADTLASCDFAEESGLFKAEKRPPMRRRLTTITSAAMFANLRKQEQLAKPLSAVPPSACRTVGEADESEDESGDSDSDNNEGPVSSLG